MKTVAKTYGPRSTKRERRTKLEMARLRAGLVKIVDGIAPATVRQIYYQAVTRDLIEKTEQEYKAIVRQLVLLRREGRIGYDLIADETRWVRRPRTFDSAADALRATASAYRRSVWSNLPCRVEVWIEKEALAGVLVDVTDPWDVPLMVTRGYSSLSYLHRVAEDIREAGKPTWLYYFGDRDPSGRDIARTVERTLRAFVPDAELHFELAAVTDEQVRLWDLPTRPTKKSDSRAAGFKGRSVEVDAIHPDRLRELARSCIERHVPKGHMDVLRAAEESERSIMVKLARRFP